MFIFPFSCRPSQKKGGNRPGLERSLPDWAALDNLWNDPVSELGPSRELAREALHPGSKTYSVAAFSTFAYEVQTGILRVLHFDLISQDERVFAIAGGSHIVKQDPVIRAGKSPKK